MRKSYIKTFSLCLLLSAPSNLFAEVENTDNEQKSSRLLQRITVIGDPEKERTKTGSATFISPEQLEEAKTGMDDISRILRQVPGVNIQEEEGYGKKPNIGFRGTVVERNRKITTMEDGILTAPASYTAPAAYYFPTAGRMHAIEVTKGPGAIKYGPNTVGGALNLISTPIPEDYTIRSKFTVGSDGYKQAHIIGGHMATYGGFSIETYQAEVDGFKRLDARNPNDPTNTGFDIQDWVFKGQVNTDRSSAGAYHQLQLKVNLYDELSNETYLGLSEEDFKRNHVRRYASSQLDNIDVDHRGFSLQYYGEFTEDTDLTVTFYNQETNRNWYKLQSVGGRSLANVLDNPQAFPEEFAWLRGDVNSPDDVLAVRANNREYFNRGIQAVLAHNVEVAGTQHELELGVRYHEDEEDRFQQEDRFRIENNSMVLTSLGAPGSQANRVGEARTVSVYLQDTIALGDLTLVPGVRYEHIDYKRTNYGSNDPGRTGESKSVAKTSVDELIPGIGASYQIMPELAVFGGVHRGFSPPGATTSRDVKPETSVNYELGTSFAQDSFRTELVFFYTDYSNLLGADTAAGGLEGTGDQFNAGKATAKGIEFLLAYDFSELIENSPVRVPFHFNYTYTDAQFDESFDSNFFGRVSKGDSLPYIPENQLFLRLAVETDIWSVYGSGNYVDSMDTVAGQAGLVNVPKTDSHFTVDVGARLRVHENAHIFANIHNLFDEEYIVARRPAGARPGMPRTAFAGVEIRL